MFQHYFRKKISSIFPHIIVTLLFGGKRILIQKYMFEQKDDIYAYLFIKKIEFQLEEVSLNMNILMRKGTERF